MGQLPFSRHVNACTAAKASAKPAWPGIDAAVAHFEAYAAPLNRVLGDASRYYARRDYARDRFKRGDELHVKLSDELAKLDDAHRAFRGAFVVWQQRLAAPAAGSDRGAALAATALAAARETSLLLLDTPRNLEQARQALQRSRSAQAKLAAFGKTKPDAPHPSRLGTKLDALHEQADHVLQRAASDRLTPSQRYRLASAMVSVVEAQRLALLQQLRGDEPSPFRIPALSPRGGRKPAPSSAGK
jgi:hypothetical protein